MEVDRVVGRAGLNTVDGLMADERARKAVRYIAAQVPGSYMRMCESNHRKRKRGRRR